MHETTFVVKDGKLCLAWCGKAREVLKAWEGFTGWFWFGVERTGGGEWFGFVQGVEEEWGYFSEKELEPLVRRGLVWEIEARDLPFAGRR